MLEAETFGQRKRRESILGTAILSLGKVALCSLLLLGVVIPACSVDNRTLVAEDAGAGAAGTGGDDGGLAGAAGTKTHEDATPPPRCIYPADESKPECQTLVENAGFHADSSHWQKEYDAIFLSWNEADAADNEESGSITVANTLSGLSIGFAVAGARQCLAVTPGTTYVVGADAFMVGGEKRYLADAAPGLEPMKAGLSVLFYETADCTGGSHDDSFTPSLVEAEEVWTPIGGSKVAPEKVASMAIRLVAMKPFKQISMRAYFDNVLVRAQ